MNLKLALKNSNSTLSDSDFHSPTKIADEIKRVHATGGITWLESCIEVANLRNLEVETIAKIITKEIKELLLAEASELRLLKPQYRINTLFKNDT